MPVWKKLDLTTKGGLPPERTNVLLRYISKPISTVVYDVGIFRTYSNRLEWIGKNSVCKASDLFVSRKNIFWCLVPDFDGESELTDG